MGPVIWKKKVPRTAPYDPQNARLEDRDNFLKTLNMKFRKSRKNAKKCEISHFSTLFLTFGPQFGVRRGGYPPFSGNFMFSHMFSHTFVKILLSRRHEYATRPTFVRPTWAGPDGDSYFNTMCLILFSKFSRRRKLRRKNHEKKNRHLC